MNRAVAKLTVSDKGAHFTVGDLVRTSTTGEVLRVTAARGGGPRYWEPLPLWRSAWDWFRGRGWKRTVVTEYWRGILRVYRERPSPLPRRLP